MIAIPPRFLFLANLFVGIASVSSAELTFTRLEGSDGLCSPRKLNIYDGSIYVAESGFGPEVDPVLPNETDSCFAIRGEYHCVGYTARVSMLPLGMEGNVTPVLEGLFSAGPTAAGETNEGSEVNGAQSIDFDEEGNMYTVIGLGLNGTFLDEIGFGGFGVVLKDGDVVALPWASEFEYNYDGSSDPTGVFPVPDSNPYHILVSGTKYYVVDAGCNCVMTYDMLDQVGEEDVLPEPVSVLVIPKYTGLAAIPNDQPGPCMGVSPPRGPPFCGMYQVNETWVYDTEPAPTSVYMRPGVTDKMYVSTLVGALWTEPIAQILEYDLDADGNPTGEGTELAGGFWAIVDFAFHGENILYVLELNPAGFVPFPGGRLTRVNLMDGTTEIVAESDQLFNPTGIAIDDEVIYITNNTLVPCNGHIIMARLAPSMDGFPEETSPDENNEGMDDP